MLLNLSEFSQGKTEYCAARLVGMGNQKYSFDAEETFSMIVRCPAIRLILALPVENNMYLYQIDIYSIYLDGGLKKEIRMA